MDRHFTVSIYIVHDGRVLLHKHKKAGVLLPEGGHIEKNELPQETAVREAQEEAGLSIRLYDEDSLKGKYLDTDREKMLVCPVHMVVGKIESEHEHTDFVFYAESDIDGLCPGKNESNILQWYSEDELEAIKGELLNDIYWMAKEAIQHYKK